MNAPRGELRIPDLSAREREVLDLVLPLRNRALAEMHGGDCTTTGGGSR